MSVDVCEQAMQLHHDCHFAKGHCEMQPYFTEVYMLGGKCLKKMKYVLSPPGFWSFPIAMIRYGPSKKKMFSGTQK